MGLDEYIRRVYVYRKRKPMAVVISLKNQTQASLLSFPPEFTGNA